MTMLWLLKDKAILVIPYDNAMITQGQGYISNTLWQFYNCSRNEIEYRVDLIFYLL